MWGLGLMKAHPRLPQDTQPQPSCGARQPRLRLCSKEHLTKPGAQHTNVQPWKTFPIKLHHNADESLIEYNSVISPKAQH